MSLTCEISGEPLTTTKEEVVVTPSGHVCIKRLLLTKLAENGGMDPFEPIRERPLSEDQLITLQNKTNKSVPPPRPQATSLPNLLQLMQAEYDALVLELFDTRKALDETRRELSQALYQNDAAVRVVARLSMERDAARQELERWNASLDAAATNGAASSTPVTGAPVEEDASEGVEEPQAKRRRLELSEPLKNDLPDDDVNAMVDSWQKLQPQRKPMLKAAAAEAPSPEVLAKYEEVDNKAFHKSTCKSLTCMAMSGKLIATAGKDKQVIVYNTEEKVVQQSFAFGSVATCVDIYESMVVAGDADGKVIVYSAAADDGSMLGEIKAEAPIVDVRIHPTLQHICIATSNGRVMVCVIDNGKLQDLAYFEVDDADEATKYCCGALHPDGLLYAAGTKNGQVHMWDFKNKVLASTLHDGEAKDGVVAIAFSNNGYHLATAHDSASVRFWDLRKQKVLATMNAEKDLLESVTSIAYDESGKYVAMGGVGGVEITTVKEWGRTASLPVKNQVSGILWTKPFIAVCSDNQRAVTFYGVYQ